MNNFIASIGSAINYTYGLANYCFCNWCEHYCNMCAWLCSVTLFYYSMEIYVLPSESEGKSDMSPFQAFINTLNVSIGNGSIAGMATAIYSGGPGAALWIIIITVLVNVGPFF